MPRPPKLLGVDPTGVDRGPFQGLGPGVGLQGLGPPPARPTVDALDGVVEAMLEGGPASMPVELRAHRVQPDEEKIKVSFYGGHEHFERVPDSGAAGAPVVFRWTGRTRLAE